MQTLERVSEWVQTSLTHFCPLEPHPQLLAIYRAREEAPSLNVPTVPFPHIPPPPPVCSLEVVMLEIIAFPLCPHPSQGSPHRFLGSASL